MIGKPTWLENVCDRMTNEMAVECPRDIRFRNLVGRFLDLYFLKGHEETQLGVQVQGTLPIPTVLTQGARY